MLAECFPAPIGDRHDGQTRECRHGLNKHALSLPPPALNIALYHHTTYTTLAGLEAYHRSANIRKSHGLFCVPTSHRGRTYAAVDALDTLSHRILRVRRP